MDIMVLFELVGIRPTTESSVYAMVYLFSLFLSSADSNVHIGEWKLTANDARI